ncbi:MAG: BMP family ABC transporter substrate-binding protein [Eubacteriales bacterium]|nr:BMP family ABC transporter substrate-binding protein [Eubacteriales bacterium]
MKKKLTSAVLAAAMLVGLAGLVTPLRAEEDQAAAQAGRADADGKYEIALITDVGTIDDRSFNQGSWEGVKSFAEENDKSYKYYKPTEQSDAAYEDAIDLAINGGAKVVVCPGFLFEVPIYVKSEEYPDVKFILIDGVPHPDGEPAPEEIADNTIAVNYREEQAGFLAGYAAVIDGNRKLGFMGGMAVPAVVRFGYGFAQGAEVAAKELGLAQGDVSLKYTYVGGFNADPKYTTMAASWYNEGVEVIFACGGQIGSSIMAGAEQSKGKVIGVDVDQSADSETVITSAMKNLKLSVYENIKKFYDDSWKGEVQHLGAHEDMVLIAMDTARFDSFNQEKYDEIYEKLKNDEFEIKTDKINEDGEGGVEALELELVTVENIE